MRALVAAIAVIACVPFITAQGDNDYAAGLSCAQAGYMFPDSDNLCFVWFCERAGETPIKRPCPKGVRVPSWWEGGELNMCNVVNILKHGGEPTCLRCAANDEKPADNCADHDSPCEPECTCVDMEYTHRCDCPYEAGAMFKPDTVEFPADHCETNPCENGATCQNQWDGFFCFCPNGYTGHRCETNICDWHPCLNGGTCVVDEVGYHCECSECWTGSCCNVTTQDCAKQCGPCKTGANCEENINTCGCTDTPCPNGVCVDTADGPQCQDCDACFTGPLCKARVDSCECTKDCPENSRCEDLIDKASHECVCNDCWRGANCDIRVDSCECSPCPDGALCTMSNGKKSCGCESNCVTGDDCSIPVKSCECSNPCKGGSCVDTADGPVCQCGDCLTGEYCEQAVKSCDCENPCSEGQECNQSADGAITCGCANPCKTGPDCSVDVVSCECANPCISGECYEMEGALACRACANCLGGEYCGEKIVDCDCNSPCSENEVCNMVDGAPVCGCPACKTGATCQENVNSCECNNPCKDPGTCQESANGPKCVCDCVGNEECREDKETGQPKCVCPVCFQNLPGESGCNTPVTHLCVCNNPCTQDQQVCIDSEPGKLPECKIGNPSSGNAFTVVFEENDTEKAYKNIPLELYITPATPNSGTRFVNIRSPGLRQDHHCYFNVNVTVPENNVYRYAIERCMMHNKTGLDRVSIRLTELNNDTMLVYGINKDRWSADGFLATPDVQAGTHFQTVSYSPAHKATQFAIAALYDDTDIEIEVNGESDLPANEVVGGVYKLTMDAFETFQVQATCPYDRTKQSFCNKDLTSSVIKASRPIHVFSGNIRAFIEAGQAFSRDHLVEELVPVDRWGTYFGLMSVPNRVVGDLLNIMAVKGQTTKVDVYYKNGDDQVTKESFTLPINGKSYKHQEVPSGKRIVIKSDKPLSVTQWTKSKDEYLYFNETVHDPVSITVPPVQQFTNSFFISTPLFTGGKDFNLMPYNTTYAMLVAKQGDEQNIKVDGKAISEFVTPWAPMPAVAGEEQLVGAVIKLHHGTTLIQNDQGANFQCLIYGFDDRESYGFPAAMNFAVMSHN